MVDACTQQEGRHKEDDYYYALGCHYSSSEDQILAEYKHRILLYHPDKNQDDTSTAQFQKLQEAKEVLCDPDKRKIYDRWRTSGIAISYKQWVALNERSTVVFHWAVPKHEGKMLESTSSSTLEIAELKRSQHSKIGITYLKHNSILDKFRNYEI